MRIIALAVLGTLVVLLPAAVRYSVTPHPEPSCHYVVLATCDTWQPPTTTTHILLPQYD